MAITQAQLITLRATFGTRLQENVSLKRYTAARIGGAADALIAVKSESELARAAQFCWEQGIPFKILGSGSNVLVSDRGVRELVVLNQAKKIVINTSTQSVSVWAESGVNFGLLARKAAALGLTGLEWAAGIPGTLGGAVYGNAGAHGSDMSSNMLLANILHLKSINGVHRHEVLQEEWPVGMFEYGYRSSSLKRLPGKAVVLSATLKVSRSTTQAVQARMDEFKAMRRNSQPSGASLGSIFKNPPGDYAGRMIEATGLKGMKLGKVEVSPVHANFFINQDSATAGDYASLISLVQERVQQKFGISLEPEIEFFGDWTEQQG